MKVIAAIVNGESLRNGERSQQEQVEAFQDLCNLNGVGRCLTMLLATLEKRKWNKPQLLLLGEDVVKLNCHLKEVAKEYSAKLDILPFDSDAWYTLAKVTLCQLILFNRRRS